MKMAQTRSVTTRKRYSPPPCSCLVSSPSTADDNSLLSLENEFMDDTSLHSLLTRLSAKECVRYHFFRVKHQRYMRGTIFTYPLLAISPLFVHASPQVTTPLFLALLTSVTTIARLFRGHWSPCAMCSRFSSSLLHFLRAEAWTKRGDIANNG